MSEPTESSARSIAGYQPSPASVAWSADADDAAEQRTPLDPDEIDSDDVPTIADDRPEADVLEQWATVPDDPADDYR